MPAYLLIRRLPTGEIKSHTTPFASINYAARTAALCLKDNGAAHSADARLFGDALARRPIGTICGHKSGYDFRIVTADFTADKVAITPGARLFNYYDRVWVTVVAEQFMFGKPTHPGGDAFDGWYDVARESDGYISLLNGERLATKES